MMKDLELRLANTPGALAAMGEALGAAGVSVEGGGVWSIGEHAVAHFLVRSAHTELARIALASAQIHVTAVHDVVTLKLAQEIPGQLGRIARQMAQAGVNIRVQYSDHANNLILVADQHERAKEVAAAWAFGASP